MARVFNLLGILLVLAGCTGGKLSCPASDFDAFLARYRESESLQRAYTRAPLLYAHVVDGDPEPTAVTERQAAGAIKFPVIASSAQVKAAAVEVTVEQTSSGVTVREVKPDADSWQVIYRFERAGGCWELAAVDDQSL